MNRVIYASALASAAFLSAVSIQPVLAQQAGGVETRADAIARADARFDRLDTNKDGKLTPQEIDAGRPGPGGRGAPGADGAPPPPPPPPPAGPGGPTERGPMGARMFARMDANGDGVVDREEYRAVMLRRFDRIDTNKDGKIDAEEREAARDAMMDRMGGPGAMPPPPPPATKNTGQ